MSAKNDHENKNFGHNILRNMIPKDTVFFLTILLI